MLNNNSKAEAQRAVAFSKLILQAMTEIGVKMEVEMPKAVMAVIADATRFAYDIIKDSDGPEEARNWLLESSKLTSDVLGEYDGTHLRVGLFTKEDHGE